MRANLETKLLADLEKAPCMIDTLSSEISQLLSPPYLNAQQHKSFQDKLDAFLKDKNANFLQIVDRICAAEAKLEEVQNKLKDVTADYKKTLEEQDEYIKQLEQMPHFSIKSDKEPSTVKSLGRYGLYASPKNKRDLSENNESLLIQTYQPIVK
jgi:septation ring formation regulator EzrA